MTILLPEVNFIETNAQVIADNLITYYEKISERKLAEADPLRLIFLSCASVIAQQNSKVNDAARQNLLYYARDKMLDHKGAEWSTPRIQAAAASTIMRFTLSQIFESTRLIPAKTLVTADGTIFFETIEEAFISPGQKTVDIEAHCTLVGTVGNIYKENEINTLVKPIAYIESVTNIIAAENGADIESDEAYKARIYQAPETLSTAGSNESYKYYAKSASALIDDVHVYSPSPGHVRVSILLQNGELPNESLIHDVERALNADNVRPLTDYVTVAPPEIVTFNINLIYWLDNEATDKNLSRQAVIRAIENYIIWQTSKIGRDINPSKLISDVMQAGAKRVEVIEPIFTVINNNEVAQNVGRNVSWGGLE